MDNFIMQRSHWSKKVNTSITLLVNVAQMLVSNKILSLHWSKKMIISIILLINATQIASVHQNDALLPLEDSVL